MVVFETKLICPLSVRFSQAHIRPWFRDTRDVDEASNLIRGIVVPPGSDSQFDIILHVRSLLHGSAHFQILKLFDGNLN